MIPIALTIAGSDSGGGAGIEADLKTFHAFGVYGTAALTAVTAQNTLGVRAVHPIPADVVEAQIRAIAEDLRPVAFKTGMLATATLVETVSRTIRSASLGGYVLDPVMVASSGDRLLDEDAVAAVSDLLLPQCVVATPNLEEAAILTGIEAAGEDAMRTMASALVERGAGAALVKGGHLRADTLVDVLYDGRGYHRWQHPRIPTRSTHGTGCTLSAGIAAGLALGRPLLEAVTDALDFVQRAIALAPGLGSGHGPLNHFVAAPPTDDR